MTDPYETLGVARDASPQELKRAYRAKAKAAHPDAGGPPEGMAELSAAYAILISPERREAYDQAGQTAEKDTTAAAMSGAAKVALQMLLENEGISPKRQIDDYEKGWARAYQQKKAEIQAQQEQLERAQKRIIRRPERDIIGPLLEGQAQAAEREIRKLEEENGIQAEVVKILRSYEFEEPRFAYAYYGTASSATTGGFTR
jgi:curved DNA-binding protein CbpA